MAIPPNPSKKVKINPNPSPEFCIPVSMANVFLSSFGNLNNLATESPVNIPTVL